MTKPTIHHNCLCAWLILLLTGVPLFSLQAADEPAKKKEDAQAARAKSPGEAPKEPRPFLTTFPLGNSQRTLDAIRGFLMIEPGKPLVPRTGPAIPETRYRVFLESEDGMRLVAYYGRTVLDADAPIVILVHEEFSDHNQFNDFGGFLLRNGYSVMAVDLRGYGLSRQTVEGRRVVAENFEMDPKTSRYTEMFRDVGACIQWLKDNKQLGDREVFLFGTGVGCNIVGFATTNYGVDVTATVMVSPTPYYRHINLSRELANIQGRPILGIASAEDTGSIQGIERLQKINRDVQLLVVDGGGKGRQLLGNTQMREAVLKFFQENTEEYKAKMAAAAAELKARQTQQEETGNLEAAARSQAEADQDSNTPRQEEPSEAEPAPQPGDAE